MGEMSKLNESDVEMNDGDLEDYQSGEEEDDESEFEEDGGKGD